ncbi:hypothetical protein DPSP01_004199 [Paraphaeosphaeria sporulosa]
MASRARLTSAFTRPSWYPFRVPPAAYQQPIRYQSRQSLLHCQYSSRLFRRNYSKKRSTNSHPDPTPHLGSPEPQSFTARLKKLSREYGWTVVGVYLALTVADLPLCFLAVKYVGAERIDHVEHVVVGGAKDLIGRYFPNLFDKGGESDSEIEAAQAEQEEQSGGPTFWTKLGLVFLVHKSFIFIRVPLTAAVTPKVVKTLRGWGYDIGKRKPKRK